MWIRLALGFVLLALLSSASPSATLAAQTTDQTTTLRVRGMT